MDGNKFSYEWIETLPHLEGVARILGQAKAIGVDLEADSLYHYFEKVCLIQIATESASYVIDPLALRDLSALHPVFSNPRIRKVFHGADYDIRSLYRAVKNHYNGARNPIAQYQQEITIETVLKSTMVAEPLRRFDCSPITDGAAAVIVAPLDRAKVLGASYVVGQRRGGGACPMVISRVCTQK